MKSLNIIAPIGFTGYGIAALNILKELSKKYNTTLFPVGQPRIDTQEDLDTVQKSIDNQENFDYDATCLKIWHQFDLGLRIGTKEFIAYPFFELDTFTKREKHHLSYPDKIIVSSQWAKTVIEKNNITTPTYIAPLGVDRNIFDDKKNNIEATQNLPYIFLNIGKWEIRKGHNTLIEVFNNAFNSEDNVELWLVTENPFLNEQQTKQWIDLAQNSKLSSKIRIFPRLQTHENVAEVMSYSSCGIFLSRAEGWNLELLEMMSMNKPVIATNYSSHTEFCNKDNSYLLDITDTEPAFDNKWFNGEGNWAKITDQTKEQCIEYMRYVYKNNIRTNNHGVDTAIKYSWENTANHISNIIG